MKKKYYLWCLSLLGAGPVVGQPFVIQNIHSRKIENLDGQWHYQIDPYGTGESGKYYLNRKPSSASDFVEYDFSASPTLEVPADWNSQDPRLLYYEGIIWYERDFNVQPNSAKRYFLHLGSVNYEAEVYLNGKKLGKHSGGFTPFEFEVTGLLLKGNNFIIVKADNTRMRGAIPSLDYDWWNYGGITGDVSLAEMPETFIQDDKIQLAKGDTSTISGSILLNGKKAAQKVQIRIPEAGLQFETTTDGHGESQFSFPVKNVQYWSPDHPKLYQVLVCGETDTVRETIGFRTIQVRGQDLLLNGRPVFLRGVCLHDENPLIPGRPRSEADERMLFGWARELNCNFVRLAHYPHNEYAARVADEMGLLLWEEIPVYWNIDWTNDSSLSNAEEQLSGLIQRDKNRASVIIWSIGNETPSNDVREKFMESLADKAHELDDTRLVSAALLVHDAGNHTITLDDPLGKKVDVVSFNEYYGWYVGGLQDIGKYKFKINYDKPVLVSEFGAGALGGFHADAGTRWSEEYQELFFQDQLKLLSAIDGLRGTCPWVLVDFRSPKRLNPVFQNGWNRKGLYTQSGVKKKAFFVMKHFYDQMQVKYEK
jgi:beta-glucuronidase